MVVERGRVFGMLSTVVYVDVIPLQRLPRSLTAFTYSVPETIDPQSITVGCWVQIQFRSELLDGVVWNIRNASPRGLSRILSIRGLLAIPPLTSAQREVALELTRTSFISMATAIRLMLPSRPLRKERRSPRHLIPRSPRSSTGMKLGRTRLQHLQRLASRLPGTPSVFLPVSAPVERIVWILALLSRVNDKQQLVVVPTRSAFLLLLPALIRHFPQRVIPLDSDAPKASYWENWQRVQKEKTAIVLTTKRGVFAPFQPLATICIDSATDDSHKQWDRDPRYDARLVANALARRFHANLFLLDAAPSLAMHENRRLVKASVTPFPQKRVVVKAHRGAHSTGSLSDEAIHFLQKRDFPTLVFFNRIGYARVTECPECGWLFACGSCGTPLVFHARTTSYECFRCRTRTVSPPLCPRCASPRLRPRAFGSEHLEELVRAALPAARVARCDRTNEKSSIVQADVVVATEQLFSVAHVPRFQSILIPSLDSMLQFHEYAATERAYLLLERCMGLGAEHSSVLIQTYHPEQAMVRAILHHNPELLYREERKLRQTLLLPPKARLIKLLLRSATPQTADQKARSLAKRLEQTIGNSGRLEGPFIPRALSGPQHRRILLLRLLERDIPDTLQRELRDLPHEWHVDPDPLTLDI